MESEIFICKHCGREHEALTHEVASYFCPNLPKLKTSVKVLDSVMRNNLTKVFNSRQTQDPNENIRTLTDHGDTK